jgi:hypothetical protein
LRDGKIAVWETAFNIARADQAGGVAEMLGQAASRAGARERRRWYNARRASDTVIVRDGQISGSPVQPHFQKYSGSLQTQITSTSIAIPAHTEGRFAIVTDVGQGCDGRGMSKTNDVARGRRSRVVLTPRRWRQVGGAIRKRRWQTSPVTGESAK